MAVALDRDRHRIEIEIDRHRLGDRIGGIAPQQRHGFAHARLQHRIRAFFGEVRGVHPWRGAFQPAQLGQLLGRHGDLVRSAPAQ